MSSKTAPDTRIYAIGDIHGCLDLLDSILVWIEEDVKSHTSSHTVLVFMGDYVDRGPHIKETIERLIGGFPFMDEVIYLRGNHEQTLLEFLAGKPVSWNWFKYGGLVTLESYGIPSPTPDIPDVDTDFDVTIESELSIDLNKVFPQHHHDFLKNNLTTTWVSGDYFFVHAGLRPGVEFEDQVDHDLIWIRDDFMNSDADFGKIIVHGHTITDKPDIKPNRIGIDTGAFSRGLMTCLVLEGIERKFVFATDDGVTVSG